MRWVASLITVIASGYVCAFAQTSSDQELAHLLSEPTTQQRGIARILENGQSKVPLILSWTRNPPAGTDRHNLYIGLADVFGRLKTKEAIPFLIKNISLQRWLPTPDIWMKTPQVVEERLPAAAALIQIGPEASEAVIHTSWERLKTEDRLAAIFVVTRIREVPETRAFLSNVLGQANMERHWAEEGFKTLDSARQ